MKQTKKVKTVTAVEKDREDNNVNQTKKGMGLDFDEMTWDQLPAAARKAASVLGIDKNLWDRNTDDEPSVSNKYWKELKAVEKKAARRLGYNQAKWDDDRSGSQNRTRVR